MATIRKATKDELPALFSTERENMRDTANRVGPEPWSDEACMTHLESALERGSLWVYEDGAVALGHCCYSPMKKAGCVSLDSLQVRRTSHSRGIGSRLLSDFLQRVRAKGFSKAALYVHRDSPAPRLYARFGLSEVRRSASHIRMERCLDNSDTQANNGIQANARASRP